MQIRWRFWIEKDGKPVMGKGGYEILKAVKECGSILKASKKLGMSYRFMWDYLRKMEDVLGEKVVTSERGGAEGGKTMLTPFGEKLLRSYESFECFIESALKGVRGVVKEVEDGKIVVEVECCDFDVGDRVVIIRNDHMLGDKRLIDDDKG
jgi:molybdate transport system regulatory protein